MSPLLGVKEEVQSFFDLQNDSKNLTVEKKVENAVLMTRPYKGHHTLHYMIPNTLKEC